MLKKSITYTNPFNDQEVTEDHYFHISKADMIEMEMEEHGATYTSKDGQQLTGYQAKMQRIVDAEDGKAILDGIKEFLRRSYGKKVGDSFRKSEAIWEEFSGSEAYSQMLFDLCTDAELAGQFINGVFPNNLAEEAQKIAEKANGTAAAVPPSDPNPPTIAAPEQVVDANTNSPEPRILSREEIATMPADDLSTGLSEGRYKLS